MKIFFPLSALQAASAGLFQHWRKRSVSVDKCKIDKKNHKEKVEPIKLIHLSSAFLVLGVGLSLGFLVFLLEKIFAKLLKKTNNRWMFNDPKKMITRSVCTHF